MTLFPLLSSLKSKLCVRPFLLTVSEHVLCKRCLSKLYKSPGSRVAQLMAELKKVNPNAPPPTIRLTLLGNGGLGNPCSLYLFTDNKRYLFNCGEGTQRLATEHKQKLIKIEDVFLTRTTWDKFGGLPGLSMTLKSIGTTSLRLHGPSDLVELFNMTKYFGVDASLTVTQHDYNECTFKDTVMEVHRIELSSKEVNPTIDSTLKKLKTTSENEIFCYVCDFHDKPGELMIKKCMEFKVPAGPLLGKLKSGEDVTLPDGRIVFSKDVVGEPEKGPLLFIIDCPTIAYLKKLLASDVFLNYREKCINGKILNTVVHFTPSSVVNSAEYSEFIDSFPNDSFHMYVNDKCPRLANVASSEFQIQMNLIDSQMFPLLKQIPSEDCENVRQSPTGLQIVLRPKAKAGIIPNSAVNFDEKLVSNEALKVMEFPEAVEEYSRICKEKYSELQVKEKEYPELIFIGTGSATPSKYRNSSCILVRIDEETSLMLDCGEGSYGQLTRFFGDDTGNELRKLKAIYVSHFHADHQLGIIDILRNRESLNVPPLPLIIPETVSDWLKSYSNSYESIGHLFNVYSSLSFRSPNSSTSLLTSLKLKSLVTVKVPHCRDSVGIIFVTDTEPSYKMVYSGDAMPSSSLVREGMDCDILIHEATMEDDLLEEAVAKRHSTMSQAIEMGWKMKAKTTILTHFSQRYCKIPMVPDEIMNNVGIAFDNMRIHICDLDKLPYLVKPVKTLFHDEYDDMMERTSLRMNRKQIYKESVA